ncbi:MAG: hypothetical protein KKF66_08450, partial [Actinobacteria bacterium]|nr:hypothetical protein [Actinomycetota bacterium]
MADDGNARDPESDSVSAELEKLRVENAVLKEEHSVKRKRKDSFSRSFLVWFLIVLACLTAFGGAIAVWTRATTLDTDDFVNTVAPLIKEDAVATVISNKAVDALFKDVYVTGHLEEALPEDLQFVTEPLSNVLETLAGLAAKEILTSDQFYWVWENALRLAHSEAVEVIRGDSEVKLTEEGKVVLDLGELLSGIRDQLVDNGMEFLKGIDIPDSAGQFVLFEADNLGMAKDVVNLLDTVNWALPLLSLIFFIVAVLIAKDRRKALLGAGVGLAVAMVLTLIVLRLAKEELLGQIKDMDVQAAAGVVWNHVFAGLVRTDWGALTLGVLVAVGAAVAGPYNWAISLRKKTAGLFGGWRERRKSGNKAVGPVGAFIADHAGGLRIVGAAVALIILLLLPHLSALALIITAVVYLA